MRLRSPDSGTFSTKEEQEEIEAEGERLLDEREAELRRRLQGFEDGTTKYVFISNRTLKAHDICFFFPLNEDD